MAWLLKRPIQHFSMWTSAAATTLMPMVPGLVTDGLSIARLRSVTFLPGGVDDEPLGGRGQHAGVRPFAVNR